MKKYNINRILGITLMNLLFLFMGGFLGGSFFGDPLKGVLLSFMGVFVAWPALLFAAIYTDYLLFKQSTDIQNNIKVEK